MLCVDMQTRCATKARGSRPIHRRTEIIAVATLRLTRMHTHPNPQRSGHTPRLINKSRLRDDRGIDRITEPSRTRRSRRRPSPSPHIHDATRPRYEESRRDRPTLSASRQADPTPLQ
jgi:hypothetical protein